MIAFTDSLVAGLVICVPFTLFVLITFWRMPRVWLHSLPADIARAAGPKTPQEQWTTRWVMMPTFLAILPGMSLVSAFWLASGHRLDLSFAGAVLHLYVVWTVVHVWDFLVIDCVYATAIDPARPPIGGTEGAAGWKDYGFHFRSLLVAIPMSGLFIVPAAAIIARLT